MMPPGKQGQAPATANGQTPYLVVYGASPYGYFAGMQVPLPTPMMNAAGGYTGPIPANQPPHSLMQQMTSPADFYK